MKALKDFLLHLAQPELAKIHKYRNRHKGESCYIFGDGISIKWFELKEFSNRISISASLIPFHKRFSALDVKYLILAEPFWFFPELWTKFVTRTTTMPQIQRAYREVIRANADKQFFLNLSNFPVISAKNITYFYRDFVDDRLPKDFITHRINAFDGSLRTSILLAIYMGFDNCYLVGCDYTHVPSRTLHWYEKGQGIVVSQGNYNKEFFKIAQEYIDITTITLDGHGNYIDAENYKAHTGCDPVFKENTELVDEKYLDVLATWPGYSIR